MTFKLPPLPYAYDALGPFMSAKTLEFHHDKHHQAYVDMANKLVPGTKYEGKSIEEICKEAYADKNQPIINNVGQHFNHLLLDAWRLQRFEDVGVGVAILVQPSGEGAKGAGESLDIGARQSAVLVDDERVVHVSGRAFLEVGDEGADVGDGDAFKGGLGGGETLEEFEAFVVPANSVGRLAGGLIVDPVSGA